MWGHKRGKGMGHETGAWDAKEMGEFIFWACAVNSHKRTTCYAQPPRGRIYRLCPEFGVYSWGSRRSGKLERKVLPNPFIKLSIVAPVRFFEM